MILIKPKCQNDIILHPNGKLEHSKVILGDDGRTLWSTSQMHEKGEFVAEVFYHEVPFEIRMLIRFWYHCQFNKQWTYDYEQLRQYYEEVLDGQTVLP